MICNRCGRGRSAASPRVAAVHRTAPSPAARPSPAPHPRRRRTSIPAPNTNIPNVPASGVTCGFVTTRFTNPCVDKSSAYANPAGAAGKVNPSSVKVPP
jgi:hypothetical protein